MHKFSRREQNEVSQSSQSQRMVAEVFASDWPDGEEIQASRNSQHFSLHFEVHGNPHPLLATLPPAAARNWPSTPNHVPQRLPQQYLSPS